MSPTLHATAVVLSEHGVLIRGRSGAGKSSLALALLAEARRRGLFGRLVGDDRVVVTPHGDRLVARGVPALRGRIERRGEGVIETAWEAAARLRLVVDLLPATEVPRLPEPAALRCTLAGVTLPRLMVPEGDGRADTPARVLDILTTTVKT